MGSSTTCTSAAGTCLHLYVEVQKVLPRTGITCFRETPYARQVAGTYLHSDVKAQKALPIQAPPASNKTHVHGERFVDYPPHLTGPINRFESSFQRKFVCFAVWQKEKDNRLPKHGKNTFWLCVWRSNDVKALSANTRQRTAKALGAAPSLTTTS